MEEECGFVKKILIVEDDKVISKELEELLNHAGYETATLKNFSNATSEILESTADLVLLDINIPVVNGEMILKNIREKSEIPVIMVTSRNSETDEVLSISFGADDYITKPYNPNILLLRIGAVLKRVGKNNDVTTYRGLNVNAKKGVLSDGKRELWLTKNEMIIFQFLLNHQGSIVSRDDLMTDLWNNDEYINDNALTVNISRLRAKLTEFGIINAIETRKGQGYILL